MAAAEGQLGPEITADHQACEHKQTGVGCDDCGACCREAFDSVPVYDDNPIDQRTARLHPTMLRHHDDGWRDLQRVPTPCGTACKALYGGDKLQPYRCHIYADRPSTCRDLKAGSDNCLFARRRVGLSPDPRNPPPDNDEV